MKQEDKKQTKGVTIGKVLQGRWLVKHVRFALFLSVLAVVYIANGHYTDNTIRNIGKAQQVLKQQQYMYKSLMAEVMFRSKESELAKTVEPLGLKVLKEPPVALTPDSSGMKSGQKD